MRKNTLRGLGIAVAAMLIMAGCGKEKNAKKSVESISFDMFNYDVIAEVEDWDSLEYDGDQQTRYIRMVGEGVLPRDNGDKGIKALRDSLMKLTQMKFADDGNPTPAALEGTHITDLSSSNTDACGYSENTLSASLVSPRVVVFENHYEGYECRAAHGMTGKGYVNYDIENEKILSLADLMKPSYEKQLVKLVRKAVKETDIPLMVELNEVEIPEQFSITPKGVQFTYNPYEIAPYAAGVISVEIATEALTEGALLSEQGSYLLTGE
jgi:hypothetical protein